MANTYSQIYIHVVFATRYRENIISKEWRDDLHRYIAGIITNTGAKSLAVGGWNDHVHLFFGMPPTLLIPELVNRVKANSSKWVNENRLMKGKFRWQSGYGAFSYSKNQRDIIIKYIKNQEEHHRSMSFKEEYVKTLTDFGVDYDARYLFEFYN